MLLGPVRSNAIESGCPTRFKEIGSGFRLCCPARANNIELCLPDNPITLGFILKSKVLNIFSILFIFFIIKFFYY
jgi:hypothetical protein